MQYSIKLYEKFGKILNIRSSAEDIFIDIPADVDEIIIDFDKIEFIGRSFAQEYYRQLKNYDNFKISEINKCEDVAKMIKVVFESAKKLESENKF